VFFGLGQQFDAMALERGDDLCPHLAADMPVAEFLGNVLLATDLKAVHGSLRDAGGLGELCGLSSAKARAAVSWRRRPSKIEPIRPPGTRGTFTGGLWSCAYAGLGGSDLGAVTLRHSRRKRI
jgi:hypothetical protein